MRSGFFSRLAANNIKTNRRTYLPYILTCVLTVTMFYLVKSLSLNPGLKRMVGGDIMSYLMSLGCWVIALFAFLFLFYTNSFLVKRRKKEFGLLYVLGMEKRHLARVLGWETLYVTLFSLAVGLGLGIVLDKAMFLFIAKIIGAEITLGFFVSPEAIGVTAALFGGIFLLIFCNAVRQIHVASPVNLLRAASAGEREPKTRWLMAILGLACLGSGYYIAIATEDPVASLMFFFLAVILVIIGTYLLFTAGSIALLKLLRRRKRFYYQTRHFTSVSGMIYRMKQNAVGLANICILSTMVLVMVSTTTSLLIGLEDVVRSHYPTDLIVYASERSLERDQELIQAMRQLQREKQLPVTGEVEYTYLQLAAVRAGEQFYVTREAEQLQASGPLQQDDVCNLCFVPLEDYNLATGSSETLQAGEVLLYANRQPFDGSVVRLFGREYRVVKRLDRFMGHGDLAANIFNTYFIVVPKMEDVYEISADQAELLAENAKRIRRFYGFDTSAEREEQLAFYGAMQDLAYEQEYVCTLESRAESRQSITGLYGGLFFIGVFLGLLFVMATVLIIYYKQISEGYEDRARFAIMRKVGMSREEVKRSIHSQVLTVFFLPLLVAGVHVTMAFPMISKLLGLLQLSNTALFIRCTVVTYLIFAVLYVTVYLLTARSYDRIVSRSEGR